MADCIVILNAGSSSIKFAIYEAGPQTPVLFRGQVEQIGSEPRLRVADAEGKPVAEAFEPINGAGHQVAAKAILSVVRQLLRGRKVGAVGHRVAHGGMKFTAPVRIDAEVLAALTALAPLAPLHQPHNLGPIKAIKSAAPDLPQVACFDTAFHRGQPPLAQLYALPRQFSEAGVKRYGFHGLSYEYVSQRLSELAPDLAAGRVIIAHLGNGASLCALKGGKSIATTMGFTAVDGLVMGTRCGAIDPGVLLYLMDAHGMDARAIEDLIYKRSGLLGVSGVSADMRKLRASPDPAAAEAIALFVYRIVREIGSLAAALGGLDALVFAGGIGEHDMQARAEIAAGCDWLGVALDETRNREGVGRIDRDASRVAVWVIPTDEERMMARHTAAVLGLK